MEMKNVYLLITA